MIFRMNCVRQGQVACGEKRQLRSIDGEGAGWGLFDGLGAGGWRGVFGDGLCAEGRWFDGLCAAGWWFVDGLGAWGGL